MSRWEDNVFGKVSKSDLLDVGFETPTRQNDPIDGLFGDDKTDNLVAEWESIAGEYQVPMMAQFHGFDTESQTTFRIPIDVHNIEKGLIKVKLNQSERLRALMNRGVQGDSKLYDYVLKDSVRLADQVITRSKVAKNELLATGKVTIKENNLDLTVDYGVPAENLAYTFDVATTADIDAQLEEIIDDAVKKGVVINGIVTSKKVLNKIRRNAGLQTNINGNVGAGSLIRQTSLEEYLEEEYGINQIVTNDLTYGADTIIGADGRPIVNQKKYYPENKITFFASNPGGKVGTGLWGNPPEADTSEFNKVENSEESPYVYITQWSEKDPAVLWTKASSLFMPVLYNPNSLYIGTVTETEGA